MNTLDVTFVRVYLTESEDVLEELLGHLHDEEKVQGVTVFRGISGFGKSGKMHAASLMDISLDLPLVVEFFEVPDKTNLIREHILRMVETGHIDCRSGTLVV